MSSPHPVNPDPIFPYPFEPAMPLSQYLVPNEYFKIAIKPSLSSSPSLFNNTFPHALPYQAGNYMDNGISTASPDYDFTEYCNISYKY